MNANKIHRNSTCWVLILCLFVFSALLLHQTTFTSKRILVPVRTSFQNDIKINHINAAAPQEKPRTKMGLGFLKVHKAASTTTQAIFLRYGWTRNLTFILPPEYNAFYYPNVISTNESLTSYNILKPPKGQSFDILCHHVVYDKDAWGRYLPEDTLKIGTVRQPFILFISMLNYMNPGYIRRISGDDQLGEYLRNPMKYELRNVRYSYTNNRMAFEYGVDPEIIMNKHVDKFKAYLYEVLDKEFDVVVVAERYDESLVLMKRLFNWTLNDIMYAKKNVRPVKQPPRYEIKEGFEDLYKNFSIFDYLLYDFFVDKLNRQIINEGETFNLELNHFLETRKYVENFCHEVPMYIRSVTVSKSVWNDQFEITRDDCNILHRGEIEFTQDIRRRQYGNATWKWKS